ncbi:MAG: exo-beta-N-acetylmuramidase NamZ domain-containing protein [Acidobacteriota bacterium]
MGRIRLGCETLVDEPPRWLRTARLGLLANQASVSADFRPTAGLVKEAGGKLACLFSPQHGFYAEKQANMIESEDSWDSSARIPIFSLYGSVRKPTPEMLSHVDVLLIDLQDVGTRVYTYTTTMGLCMEAAAEAGVKVAILDRPNPIGGADAEGNLLKEDHRTFVGRYPVPMRHGMTMGEFARFVVKKCGVGCDLEVIPLRGWRREMLFPETGLPWIFPSPNMPSWETALIYPGMVMLEATNVSEGRGTTLPFHLFGAPFIEHDRFLSRMDRYGLEGVSLRPVCFEPVFDKWAGEPCTGFQIHVTDPRRIKPYRLGLAIVQALLELYPKDFSFLPPPYEYEREKLPIDIILGDTKVRERLEGGEDLLELERGWMKGLMGYEALRAECGIYS